MDLNLIFEMLNGYLAIRDMWVPKLVGVGHNTWGVVRLDLNGASSGSPSAATGQILPRWDSVTRRHMTQTDICLIIEHSLIRALRLTALCLRLAIVVEVVMQERCFGTILGKELLYLLILTRRYFE